jgi:hypothetical protein
VRGRSRREQNSEFMDIVLRKVEPRTTIVSDDKLDRRPLRDWAGEMGRRRAPHFYNPGGFLAIGKEIFI